MKNMSKTAYLFGVHPLRESIIHQYDKKGFTVVVHDGISADAIPDTLPQELVLLCKDADSDAHAIRFLETLSGRSGASPAPRPLVHLILHGNATFRMLQRTDFSDSVNRCFEVWPTTQEEMWAEHVIVRYPGISENSGPPLDREPITPSSNQFIHLVIAGFDEYAARVAVKTAQVAHFPNYDGKARYPLRTRITFLQPDIAAQRDAFIARFRTLFDHSYYRNIFPSKRSSILHHPLREGRQEDFVDVEWEFVDASLTDSEVMDRLSVWATDPRRQLTLVLSDPDDNTNLDFAFSLPSSIYENHIPVWVRQRSNLMAGCISGAQRYSAIFPFGMEDSGYDIQLPAARLSKLLHYFYASYYGSGIVPTYFPKEDVERAWLSAGSLKMRLSNACNVMTMATKMHSLGHAPADLATFYAMSQDEVESLARTEHNRWSVERLLSGTRPCNDEERAAVLSDIHLKSVFKMERDAHFDLCAYDELGMDEKGNDVRIYDKVLTACIPLIVESYAKEEAE